MNEYYEHGSYPSTGAPGRSADLRSELDSIEAGFDILPPLAGNAFKVPYLNAGETAWAAIGGNGLLKLSTAGIPTIAVGDTDYVLVATFAAHLADPTDAHDASAISSVPAGTLAATDVQTALNELDGDIVAHLADPTDAHDASAISYLGSAGLSATDVEGALDELDTEKAALASPVFTGNPTAPTPAVGDDDTSIATTAFVMDAYADGFGGGSFGFKNVIINGAMEIAQRGTSFAAAATATFGVDRWAYIKLGAMVHAVNADGDTPTVAQAGRYIGQCFRTTLSTPDNAIAAGDFCHIRQHIEGFNFRALAQRSFVLSFWVKATLTGTYCVNFRNSGSDRSYVAEYTIDTTDTWEFKTIAVSASPSAGTWDYTNGTGLAVSFTLAAGTTFQTTAGSWNVGSFLATANQVNGVATGATEFKLTGVQIEAGDEATPFEMRPFGTELALCQRYYEKSFPMATAPAAGTGNTGAFSFGQPAAASTSAACPCVQFKTRKRAAPNVVIYNPQAVNNQIRNTATSADWSGTGVSGYEASFDLSGTTPAGTAAGHFTRFHWTADAEL